MMKGNQTPKVCDPATELPLTRTDVLRAIDILGDIVATLDCIAQDCSQMEAHLDEIRRQKSARG